MIIELKNIGAAPADFYTITVQDQVINPGESKIIFNNDLGMNTPNYIYNIQSCDELREYINNDIIVFIVNAVQASKAQSLNILEPVINFP